VTSAYVAIEIPDDELIRAIAHEASFTDLDLDELEKRVLSPSIDPAEAAGLSLAIARAAAPSSLPVLKIVATRLLQETRPLESKALALALELALIRPPPHLERAERGYKRTGPSTGEVFFVEDPIAAHWHRLGRWGPPLRPDLDRAPLHAGPGIGVDRVLAAIRDGAIAIVTFRAPRHALTPHAPLRLLRAGLARDPSLATLVRWSAVSSVGSVGGRHGERAAFEKQGALEVLPAEPSIGAEDLVALMTRLLQDARDVRGPN
jgi:hypothetical protein